MSAWLDYLYNSFADAGALLLLACILATVFCSTFLHNEDYDHFPRPRLRRDNPSKAVKRTKRGK